MDIRPYRDSDAEAVADVLRQVLPAFIITAAGVRHWFATTPPEGRLQMWVAEDEGRIVGVAESFLIYESSRKGGGGVGVWVLEESRRQGIGAELFALAEERARADGATQLICHADEQPEGERFLLSRGFKEGHKERISRVDPRDVDTSALPDLTGRAEEQGYRLVRLGEVRDRPYELFKCFTEAGADVPGDFPWDTVEYDNWRRADLEYPDLTDEGSFVVLAGEQPVSLAWLQVDPVSRRAGNSFTGTVRAHRRRGLGRLVKLATLEWAAGEGYHQIVTGNDSTNADMLTLNDHLGYRPLYYWRSFLRDL